MLNKISKKEISDFNRTLSLMLMSRLSIVQSLEIYYRQTRNDHFKKVLKVILKDIKNGDSLSKSFSKHKALFSNVYIANLKVAEETGQIAEVIDDYTHYSESIENLKKKILQALQYPMLVMLVAFCVIVFMVFFLIPTFQGLFMSSQAELPGITAFIVSVSQTIKDNYYILLIPIIAIVIIYERSKNVPAIKRYIYSILMRIPYISTLYRMNLLSRFSLSMAIMLKNKITLVESLKISQNITTNILFREEIDKIIKRLIKGGNFSGHFSASIFFDSTFSKLLSAGEEGAQMEKVFGLIGKYYEKEFNYNLENITSLLEPFLILFIGAIVAIILIAMYLPMFEIINNFGV